MLTRRIPLNSDFPYRLVFTSPKIHTIITTFGSKWNDTMLVLRHSEVYAIEQSCGISLEFLIQRAGQAVTDTILANFAPQTTLVLCGAGNNGNDGLTVAQILHSMGWLVQIGSYNAEVQAKQRAPNVPILRIEDVNLSAYNLIIDAIFGIGLSRDIPESLYNIFDQVNNSKRTVISIDVPSGIAENGKVMGKAIKASMTITFETFKTAHLLSPGCFYTGDVIVKNIGITVNNSQIRKNSPQLWSLPQYEVINFNKYSRGFAGIYGGERTGAARMAAYAALKVGAGIVKIFCPKSAINVYASQLSAIMIDEYPQEHDKRINSLLVGPANGVNFITMEHTKLALSTTNCVLDADALTVFADGRETLFSLIKNSKYQTVMTPHEGEFRRLFGVSDNKIDSALLAAKQSGAIVVYKGSDTVIASPDGDVIINVDRSGLLATAGSGDVLAGIITGLLANGMPALQAAGAAVWIHSKCAELYGKGLTAEDLLLMIPKVLPMI